MANEHHGSCWYEDPCPICKQRQEEFWQRFDQFERAKATGELTPKPAEPIPGLECEDVPVEP